MLKITFLVIIETLPSTSTTRTFAPTSACSLNSSHQAPPTPKSTLTYADFRKRKQAARASKIQSTKKAKTNEEVKVQIGVLEVDGGKLKRHKSRTLPLVIVLSCNALLKAAIQKHTKHFKQFNKYADYILLSPDQSIVQKLPGSSAVLFA